MDTRNIADPENQVMKSREIDVGIYRIKLTVYKTGNVHVCFVNRISGEKNFKSQESFGSPEKS